MQFKIINAFKDYIHRRKCVFCLTLKKYIKSSVTRYKFHSFSFIHSDNSKQSSTFLFSLNFSFFYLLGINLYTVMIYFAILKKIQSPRHGISMRIS